MEKEFAEVIPSEDENQTQSAGADVQRPSESAAISAYDEVEPADNRAQRFRDHAFHMMDWYPLVPGKVLQRNTQSYGFLQAVT